VGSVVHNTVERVPPHSDLLVIFCTRFVWFMRYHVEWPTELQALERKFLTKIEDLEKQFFPNHAPTFAHIIKKRIAFLKEVLGTIEANLKITTRDLAQLVDQKLEKE
jgi:hypothetical protein